MSQKSKKIIFIQIMYCTFVMCLIFITKTYSKYTNFSSSFFILELFFKSCYPFNVKKQKPQE